MLAALLDPAQDDEEDDDFRDESGSDSESASDSSETEESEYNAADEIEELFKEAEENGGYESYTGISKKKPTFYPAPPASDGASGSGLKRPQSSLSASSSPKKLKKN